MTAARLLVDCWESAYRTGGTSSSLGLLLPVAEGWDVESLGALPIGQRDTWLLDLRLRLFGQPIAALAVCPACGSTAELAFRVGDVQSPGSLEAPLRVDDRGWELDFRLPNTNDLAEAAACPGEEEARRTLIERCVLRISRHGKARSAGDAPTRLIGFMEEKMAEADPQADVRLKLTCPGCGHAWEADFDIGAFVATEIAAAARHVLREVHRLAIAYGWSEDQVLSLSAVRRQAYLDLLGAE